jgi:hypothetical protein
LRKSDPTPFPLKRTRKPDSTKEVKKPKDTTNAKAVKIDFDNIDRRTLALPAVPEGVIRSRLLADQKAVYSLQKDQPLA